MNIKTFTSPILNVLRYHKLKIFVTLISMMLFSILLFPFSDLSLFISDTIAKNTRNQVILQFEDLMLKLLPSPGFQMSEVMINTPQISSLEVEEMVLMPIFSSLLMGRMGMEAQLKGAMNGNLSVLVNVLEQNEEGISKLEAKVRTQDISIQKLLEVMQMQLNIKGVIYLQGQGQIDLTYEDQPDFRLRTQTQNFQLNALSIPTPIGPFPLPNLSLKEILIQTHLKEGQLQFETLEIGRAGDDLVGQISGYLNLQFRRGRGSPQILPGDYNLACRLTLKPNIEAQFKALIDVLSLGEHKKAGTYAFRITGNPSQVPNIRGL